MLGRRSRRNAYDTTTEIPNRTTRSRRKPEVSMSSLTVTADDYRYSPNRLVNVKRHRSEAENKHKKRKPAEPRVPSAQRNGIIDRDRMPDAEDHKYRCPEQPSLPVEDSKRDQKEQERPGDVLVETSEESIRN